jgi:rare lipoprotein A
MEKELESYDFEDDAIPATIEKKSSSTQNKNTKQVKAVSVNEDDFDQTGLASWYGREFNGRTTASGEKFDMNDSTAAHKSLPFGSIVEITNLDNGKTTRVKINDRGPYKGTRIIDLSHYAAKQIGLVEAGVGMVGINIIRRGTNSEAVEQPKKASTIKVVNDEIDVEDEAVSAGAFSIQAGAFYSKKNAESLKEKVEDAVNVKAVVVNEGDFYKVRIDGIPARRTAEKYKDVLERENISSYIIENK